MELIIILIEIQSGILILPKFSIIFHISSHVSMKQKQVVKHHIL